MKRTVLFSLLLALVTFAVFWNIQDNQFVKYDDDFYVYENPQVQAGLTIDNLKWAFTTTHHAIWHPVTWLSHMTDCQLFGVKHPPRGHHLSSVVIHALNAVLLFILLRRMSRAFWKPALVAAFFALHPMHVESVAWIADRRDILSTFFLHLCILFYVEYARSLNVRWYTLTLLALALGMMSKPTVITAPFLLLLLDYWPLQRVFSPGAPGAATVRRILLEKAPMFVLIVPVVILAYGAASGGEGISTEIPFTHKIATALTGYMRYIGKMLYPVDLCFLYPDLIGMWKAWQVMGSFIGLALITTAVFILREHRFLAVGWFWFLGTLFPVIGFVSVGPHSIADRYMYFSMTGLLVMGIWGIDALANRLPRLRPVAAVAAVLCLVVCMWLTPRQIVTWRDTNSLYEHALEVDEGNHVAHYNLGTQLSAAGNRSAAILHYRRAVEIYPPYARAYNNLAYALYEEGQFVEALRYIQFAIKAEPENSMFYNTLGTVLRALGDAEGARRAISKALEIDPENAFSHHNLASDLYQAGDLDASIHHFREALRINPDLVRSRRRLAFVLRRNGDLEAAIEQYRLVLALEPGDAEMRQMLEAALEELALRQAQGRRGASGK